MKPKLWITIGVIIMSFFVFVLFVIPSWHSYQEYSQKPLYGTFVYDPSDITNHEHGTRVYGTIEFSEPGVKFEDTTVYVKIIDATMQDVPSILLTRQIIPDVSYDSNTDEKIQFSIPIVFDVQDGMTYYVLAHADIDGSKSTSLGDYVTTTAYPVLINDFPNEQRLVLDKAR